MKNLAQILEAVDAQTPVEDQDLRLAVKTLSLYALQANKKIQAASAAPTLDFMKRGLDPGFDERFYRAMMTKPLLEFLTPRFTPGTAEFRLDQERAAKAMEFIAAAKKRGANGQE